MFEVKPPVDKEMIQFMKDLRNFPELLKELAAQHGSSAPESNAPVQEVKKEEVKVEAKAPEKKNFDIELMSSDASKKLVIIKEFKTIFNLGLKEAKEIVEKPPAVLKKGVSKEEAMELKAKLEAMGCVVELK